MLNCQNKAFFRRNNGCHRHILTIADRNEPGTLTPNPKSLLLWYEG